MVRNKSTCGTNTATYSQWVNFTLTRSGRALTINGTNVVCSGNQATFSVATSAGDANLNWTTSSNLAVANGQSTNQVGVVSSASGSGFVRVALSDGCGNSLNSSRNVYSGTPQIVQNSATVNGSAPATPNYTGSNGAFLVLQVLGKEDDTNVINWTLDGGTGTIYPNGGTGHSNPANAYPNPFMRVRATSFNSCGTGASFTFYLQSGSPRFRVAAPTGQNKLIVTFNSKEEAADLLDYVDLYTDKAKLAAHFNKKESRKDYFDTTNSVELDIANLPKAIYFLHVKMGDSITKQQVQLAD